MLLPTTQTLSTKGQLVIPSKVRKALGLTAGTKMSIMADATTKTIRVTPVAKDPIKSLTGLIKRYKPHGTFQDSLNEKYAEIKRGE